jgi:uncharacterized protein YjdB
MSRMRRLWPLALVLTLAACGSTTPTAPTSSESGDSGGSGGPASSGTATSVAVTCTADATGHQCRASAQMSSGAAQDVTNSSTWTSSNPAVATVDAAGRVTNIGSGQTEIRATYQNLFGGAIVLVNVAVTSVTVACTAETGAHVCTAVALLANGLTQDVTRSGAVWSSSNTSIATVDSAGRVAHRGNGQVEIAARFQSVVGGVVLTVSGVVTLTSVSVTCTPLVEAHQCAAVANFSDGSNQTVTQQAAWTSSNTAVATVDSTGLVRHRFSGQVQIRAAFQGLTGSITLDLVVGFGTSVVINEFAVRGVEDTFRDFVELRNDTGTAVDISGWQIREWVRTDGSIQTRFTVGSGIVLMPGCHYLVAYYPAVSGVTPDGHLVNMEPTHGGIALVRPDGTIVDQVGYSPTSPFREGTPLPTFPGDDNRSYSRLGNDTNDNASDFSLRTATPMNSSSSCAVR